MFYDIKLFLFDSEQICKYCHTVVVVAATALTTTVTSAGQAKHKHQPRVKTAFLESTLEARESK